MRRFSALSEHKYASLLSLRAPFLSLVIAPFSSARHRASSLIGLLDSLFLDFRLRLLFLGHRASFLWLDIAPFSLIRHRAFFLGLEIAPLPYALIP